MRRRIIKLLAKLGRYDKCTVGGGYYYVRGPLLTLARFAVIPEEWEFEKSKWIKEWMTQEPTGVMLFSLWKTKTMKTEKATPSEVLWFYGFQEVDNALHN